MTFYLGTHQPAWLSRVAFPLFVSRHRLHARRTFPRASCRWALDSGGFTELSMRGAWTVTPKQYVAEVRRFSDAIGAPDFAAIQDWMCEPHIIAKTGLSVAEHQRRTIESYHTLRSLAAEVNWCPVIQGFEPDDYRRHVEAYAVAGVDLATLPVVGLGSVCRRQKTDVMDAVIKEFHDAGIKLHAFGFKETGVRRVGHLLTSADSMAWSFAARYGDPLPQCIGHKNCANCLTYATQWRERIVKP